MFLLICELLTIVMGTIAFAAAVTVAVFFLRTNSRIGRAVAIDKLAEAVSMFVIVAFAIFYFTDTLVVMPVLAAVFLRALAICATMFSSINLAYETKLIVGSESKTICPHCNRTIHEKKVL